MRAIILVAGRGRRLAPMGWDKPKCLLPFGDQTILDFALAAFLANGIDRISIVVGYKPDLVLQTVKRHPVRFDVVVNPDYGETNTIYSLYLARDYLDEDFLYLNGDVLFDPRIVSKLMAEDGSAFAVEEKLCGDEEVKVIIDGSRRIIRIGKVLPPTQCLGEFIGVGKFDRSACPAMIAALRRHNDELNNRMHFFEAAVDDILAEHAFRAVSINGLPAIEIDTPEDYTAATRLWGSERLEP
jgi:choline kinase